MVILENKIKNVSNSPSPCVIQWYVWKPEATPNVLNLIFSSKISGAEVNLNIDDIDLRQALIKEFGPEILDFQPSKDAIKGLKVGNRSRQGPLKIWTSPNFIL